MASLAAHRSSFDYSAEKLFDRLLIPSFNQCVNYQYKDLLETVLTGLINLEKAMILTRSVSCKPCLIPFLLDYEWTMLINFIITVSV